MIKGASKVVAHVFAKLVLIQSDQLHYWSLNLLQKKIIRIHSPIEKSASFLHNVVAESSASKLSNVDPLVANDIGQKFACTPRKRWCHQYFSRERLQINM